MGVIDAEYIMHKSIPSLGGPRANHVSSSMHLSFINEHFGQTSRFTLSTSLTLRQADT